MKRSLIYLSPLLMLLAAGCLKSKNEYTPIPVPEGTFAGQFRAIKIRSNGTRDTVKTNLQITMGQATGFEIKGDTATVHAGGSGSFAMDASLIEFGDKVYKGSPIAAKYHLTGVYAYLYDGNKLQVGRSFGDTLSVLYDLKKN